MSYTKIIESKFESWTELLATVAGLRECETLKYHAPLDSYAFAVEVKRVFKNGKLRIQVRDGAFTADSGHFDRFSLATRIQLPDAWLVIGRGKAGWHAARENCSSSGGTLDPISGTHGDGRPWRREGYLAEAAEGCRVYDAEQAEYGAYAAFVIGGPMLKCELGDDDEDCFTKADATTAARMLPALEGGFEHIAARGIAEVAAGKRYGSLDRVGWNIWRRELERACPTGVRFGVVHNHAVVWETTA